MSASKSGPMRFKDSDLPWTDEPVITERQRILGDRNYLRKERVRLRKRYNRNPNLTLEVAIEECDKLIAERDEYLKTH